MERRMEIEFTPEPSDEERAAILAALLEAEEAESSASIEESLPVDNP
jgi:hypothetical protein